MNKITKTGILLGLSSIAVLAFYYINVLDHVNGLVGIIRNYLLFFYIGMEALGVIYIFYMVKGSDQFSEKAKTNQSLIGAGILIFLSFLFEFTLWQFQAIEPLVIRLIIYLGAVFILFVLIRFTRVLSKLYRMTSQFYVNEYKKPWGVKIDLHEDANLVFFSAIALLLPGFNELLLGDFSLMGLFIAGIIELILLPFQIHWLSMITGFEIDQTKNELRIIKRIDMGFGTVRFNYYFFWGNLLIGS